MQGVWLRPDGMLLSEQAVVRSIQADMARWHAGMQSTGCRCVAYSCCCCYCLALLLTATDVNLHTQIKRLVVGSVTTRSPHLKSFPAGSNSCRNEAHSRREAIS